MTPEVLWAMGRMGESSISPDNQKIVYNVAYYSVKESKSHRFVEQFSDDKHCEFIARMIEKGLSRLGRPLSDINTTIENVGTLEVAKLEKGVTLLSMIASASPMIGFLGTVTGMIRAFYNMSMAGNNIDIELLSGGIYEAMVTTVGGLIVGIIAYIFYTIIVAKIQNVVNLLEAKATEFMDVLNEPA